MKNNEKNAAMKVKPRPRRGSGKVVVDVGPGESKFLSEGASEPKHVFQLKKILVPIDFSECSEKALQYAIPFARQFQASLTLLYVVQMPYAAGEEAAVIDMVRLQSQMGADGKQGLAALITVNAPAAKIPMASIVREGSPSQEIIQTAQERDIDLIIISTHGRTGLPHFFLGSTAERVVRHATCPVLVVREQEHEFVAPQPGSPG